jgi:hypothetical protein
MQRTSGTCKQRRDSSEKSKRKLGLIPVDTILTTEVEEATRIVLLKRFERGV